MSDETQVSEKKKYKGPELAEALGVHLQTVYKMRKDGRLGFHEENGQAVSTQEDVDKAKPLVLRQGRPKGGGKPASTRNPSNVGNLVDELEEAALRVLRLAAELRVRIG